jgi:phytoene dehydrogenase-like protein
VLADGTRSRRRVVSGADPRTTLLDWLAPDDLPDALRREVAQLDFRSGSVKINLALDRLPAFRGHTPRRAGPEHRGTIHVGAGDLDALDAAFEARARDACPIARSSSSRCRPRSTRASRRRPPRRLAVRAVGAVPRRRRQWPALRDAIAERACAQVEEVAPASPRASCTARCSRRPISSAVRLSGRKPLPRRDDARSARVLRPLPGWRAMRRRFAACGCAARARTRAAA